MRYRRLLNSLVLGPAIAILCVPVLAQAQTGPVFGQIAKLIARDPELYDWMGWAVAIDESSLATSTQLYGGEVDPPNEPGAVYLFDRNDESGMNWSQTQKLFASDGFPGDDFGMCLEIDGNTLAIAGDQQSWVVDPDRTKGALYLFERVAPGATWLETAKIVPPQAENFDRFGCADILLDGDFLVAGSYYNDAHGVDTGAAYIYARGALTGEWTQVHELFAPDARPGDHFGGRLAMEGDLMFVSAVSRDTESAENSGAVYVFDRDAGGPDNWGHVQTIEPDPPAPFGGFGRSLAVENERLVVSEKDKVEVYRPVGSHDAWERVSSLNPTDPSAFQRGQVEIENGIISVANFYLNIGNINMAGGILIFTPDGIDSWTETTILSAADASSSLYMGWSTDFDGDYVVAGAVNSDDPVTSAGAVYIFRSGAIFADGFESGDPSAWSSTVP